MVIDDVEHEDPRGEAHGKSAQEGHKAASDVDQGPPGALPQTWELVQDGSHCGLHHAHDGGHGQQTQHEEEEEAEQGRHRHQRDGLGVDLESETNTVSDHILHWDTVILKVTQF